MSLKPVVLVDLFGLQKLSSAFGVIMLFQGVGALAGPPLAGLCTQQFRHCVRLKILKLFCDLVHGVSL